MLDRNQLLRQIRQVLTTAERLDANEINLVIEAPKAATEPERVLTYHFEITAAFHEEIEPCQSS